MSVVNHNLDNLLKFNINYPNIPYTDERMQNLKTTISTLGIPKTYNSIIEMDMYFFGLINEIIFKNKEVNIERKDELKTEIDLKINKLKETENHKYNPNALKYLKARITTSLEVYSKYRK